MNLFSITSLDVYLEIDLYIISMKKVMLSVIAKAYIVSTGNIHH